MELFDLEIGYPVAISIASTLKVYQMNLEAVQGKLNAHLDERVWALGEAMHHAHWASFICDSHVFNLGNKVVESGIWVRERKRVLSFDLDPSRQYELPLVKRFKSVEPLLKPLHLVNC